MSWQGGALDWLSRATGCGYSSHGSAATEPTALSAMALMGYDREPAAQTKLEWLAAIQNEDGSMGICPGHASPQWPTGLTVLAWKTAELSGVSDAFDANARSAVQWLLSQKGTLLPRNPDVLGHDSTLVGWPWVTGTHAWIEPTSFAVLSLKACGERNHPRTREGVRLLIDRLLPGGGCNYGNTTVLGGELHPHLQPTGLALLALESEQDDSHRVERSLAFLRQRLSNLTAAASLSYGLMGLAAHGQAIDESASWLESASRKALERGQSDRIAMLLLAGLGPHCPLVRLAAQKGAMP